MSDSSVRLASAGHLELSARCFFHVAARMWSRLGATLLLAAQRAQWSPPRADDQSLISPRELPDRAVPRRLPTAQAACWVTSPPAPHHHGICSISLATHARLAKAKQTICRLGAVVDRARATQRAQCSIGLLQSFDLGSDASMLPILCCGGSSISAAEHVVPEILAVRFLTRSCVGNRRHCVGWRDRRRSDKLGGEPFSAV